MNPERPFVALVLMLALIASVAAVIILAIVDGF